MLYPFVTINAVAIVRLDTITALVTIPGGGCRVHVDDGGTYTADVSRDALLERMSKAAERARNTGGLT